MHDDPFFLVSRQFIDPAGDLSHGNQHRSLNSGGFVFSRLTAIDEKKIFVLLLQLPDSLDVYFNG